MVSSPAFWVLFACILSFSYVNGLLDGCNVVATLITSRSMKPKPALFLAAFIEMISPFSILLIGSEVTSTIQKIVGPQYYTDPEQQTVAIAFIGSGIVAAIIWNLITWKFGIPASASHALIGGVIGAGILAFGTKAITWGYFWGRIVVMVFLAPILSFSVGFLIMKLIFKLTRNFTPHVNNFFIYAQWVNMTFLAFNHSLNDAQKSIGIMMILLGIIGGPTDSIPLWIIGSTAVTLGLGILFGGFRVIRTVGNGIYYRVRPVHSFASQLSSALVILAASMIGAPVSSSQIVSSSVMGVGAAERYKAVRWTIVSRILLSWFITIPVVALIGAALFLLSSLIIL